MEKHLSVIAELKNSLNLFWYKRKKKSRSERLFYFEKDMIK
jgi:hypothetical protein